MIPVLSVVTSVKDYLEVVHKLIEYDSESFSKYTELGPLITYLVLSLKNFIMDFISLSWLKNIWSLPILIPDISSAMISEISVLDGYFHNAFNFLETPALSPNEKSLGLITGIEKFTIGVLNSCFLFLPTSTAHIITLRRFVMQGLEAGYISGLGTIVGNVFWLASVILGWRFFVIPWLSLDILRYVLGFALLVKYMWDSYNERKMVLEDLSKRKIFLLNFLLALTEQTSIYPFISNISISPEASILETFPADNYTQFIFIHVSYLAGIGIGSFCLLQFTCWFWENPAFKLYMWVISSFKVSTGFYYKALNFIFLYLTMLSAISSIPYYGLDYTITNPLGFVNDDRLIQDKSVLETSFLGSKASDRNTRRNRGRHGRRERWKRRIRKYRTFDASLYDQGIYDLFTIEDLNYGFDRFWLRRKLRNHRVRFRFFPGPWMRSFKKQLAKPRLESYTGPRIEFFRILFEQVYHPSFHARSQGTNTTSPRIAERAIDLRQAARPFGSTREGLTGPQEGFVNTRNINLMGISKQNTTSVKGMYGIKDNLIHENSMLRKFVRKLDSRLKTSEIVRSLDSNNSSSNSIPPLSLKQTNSFNNNTIYSKRWKEIFSKIYHEPKTQIPTSNIFFKNVHRNFYNSSLALPNKINLSVLADQPLDQKQVKNTLKINQESIKKQSSRINTLSNKDLQRLRYRSTLTLPNNTNLKNENSLNSSEMTNSLKSEEFKIKFHFILNPMFFQRKNIVKSNQPFVLLHPLKFYLQQEAALQRKLRYYTPNIFRKFSVENNAPYFRVMMRRYFYNYKPTNRWERTMKVGSLRKARRKTTRTPRKLRLPQFISIAPSAIRADETLKSARTENNLTPTQENFFTNKQKNESINTSNVQSLEENALNISGLGIQETPDLAQRIQKPTFNYSVVSKKASRYRYQIYKDVMQHWYYSPFNRLLLKFDVDSFIRRQPKTHFLTSKEENLLHLRRFFLAEHYNTLRWYTNMEHYRTMKTKIGGSKSFSSRAYNQQFAGTFKKIRHLFAITPTINSSFPFDGNLSNQVDGLNASDFGTSSNFKPSNFNTKDNSSNKLSKELQQADPPTVLKFDQPLYNEYPNTSQTNSPLLNALVIHEELLTPSTKNSIDSKFDKPSELSSGKDTKVSPSRVDPKGRFPEGQISGANLTANESSFNKIGPNEDLLTQSQKVVREYLKNSSQVRKDYIQELLDNKNYASLTDFLYNGQKLRGSIPTTNQKTLNYQEKEYLLTPLEKQDIEKQYNSPEVKRMLRENLNDIASGPYISKGEKTKPLPVRASLENLYTTYLKNWKRRVNNQESLKNYLTRRIDKREKRKITKEKALQKKLKTLNDWRPHGSKSKFDQTLDKNSSQSTQKSNLLPIARSAIRADETLNSARTKENSIDININNINNINNVNASGNFSNSQFITSGLQKAIGDGINIANSDTQLSLNGTNVLNLNASLSNKIENRSSVKTLESLRFSQKQKLNREIQTATNELHKITKQLDKKPISTRTVSSIKNKVSSILNMFKNTYAREGGLSLFNFNQITQLVKPIKQKSITNWRKKQRAIGKQKRLRKEFKLLLTKKQTAQQTALGIPNRKKRTPSESTTTTVSSAMRADDARESTRSNTNLHNILANDTTENNSFLNNNYVTSFFNFKRERSPQRRYRVRRNRGVFRKRNLGDLIKKDIKIFFNKTTLTDASSAPQDILERNRFYTKMRALKGGTTSKTDMQKTQDNLQGEINSGKDTLVSPSRVDPKGRFPEGRVDFLQEIDLSANKLEFKEARVKQRKNKQRKLRSWKQKRMSLRASQKRRKYLKRRRYSISKIRVLSKQFKRVKNKLEIQNWWWKQYLPSIQASTDALWQIEKDRLIQQKLAELSPQEIMQRDTKTLNNKLQIGNKDFKPLALPEAMRIQSNLNLDTNFNTQSNNSLFSENCVQNKTPFYFGPDVFSEKKHRNKNIISNLDNNSASSPQQNTDNINISIARSDRRADETRPFGLTREGRESARREFPIENSMEESSKNSSSGMSYETTIELRKQFKDKGFLTQDSRVKERRKYGLKKARKASQYHKR